MLASRARQRLDQAEVEAFFTSESYPRGGSAHLVIADHARKVSVRIFHAGGETLDDGERPDVRTARDAPRTIGRVNGKRAVDIRLGSWPSGVYTQRSRPPGGARATRPSSLSPRPLGRAQGRDRVPDADLAGVQLPRRRWQTAAPDTWYGGGGKNVTSLPAVSRIAACHPPSSSTSPPHAPSCFRSPQAGRGVEDLQTGIPTGSRDGN